MNTPLARTLVSLLAYFSMTGCGGDAHDHDHDHGPAEDAAAQVGVGEAGSHLPESFFASEGLADPLDVKYVKDEVEAGGEIVVRGTVMDFGELATFKLVEDSLQDCSEIHDDACATPWDYCCEDATALARYTMNVEFMDGDLPGPWGVKGFHGIDHLTEVVVTGTYHQDEAGNMRLEATKIALQ